MESVFEISFCVEDCKVKFISCIFMDVTWTWWNNYTKTVDLSITNVMPLRDLKHLLINEYYHQEEIQNHK